MWVKDAGRFGDSHKLIPLCFQTGRNTCALSKHFLPIFQISIWLRRANHWTPDHSTCCLLAPNSIGLDSSDQENVLSLSTKPWHKSTELQKTAGTIHSRSTTEPTRRKGLLFFFYSFFFFLPAQCLKLILHNLYEPQRSSLKRKPVLIDWTNHDSWPLWFHRNPFTHAINSLRGILFKNSLIWCVAYFMLSTASQLPPPDSKCWLD